jgi:predicted TIM-barrel fold metal-dependent hydrolase
VIIDSLTHITRDGSWFDTGLDASLPALLKAMDRDGVDAAVLAGISGVDDDELILDAVRKHPGRFIPVAGVDVGNAGSIEERICIVKDKGYSGIKLHPRHSGVPVTGPRLHEAVKLAGRHDLPALVCTIHRPPLSPLGRPVSDALYDLCRVCDNTRIVLVHGGYADLLATSELIRPLEHVLLDLTLTLTRFARTSVGLDCAWLLETFDRRVCVGSDFPEGDMGRVHATLTQIVAEPEAVLHSMSANLLRHLEPISTFKAEDH